jgi:uncharacterized alkaline shock family protein YloU
MSQEVSRSDLGLIRIHKNAIASIASIAAMDAPGVNRISRSIKSKIAQFIGDKQHTDVKVDINKNEEVVINIPLFVKYGFNLPEVADKVQENVRLALEKMTSLSVKDVNVNIIGIERG